MAVADEEIEAYLGGEGRRVMPMFDQKEFAAIWADITEDQREMVKNKARWNQITLSAVMIRWPYLIAPHVLHTKPSASDAAGKDGERG